MRQSVCFVQRHSPYRPTQHLLDELWRVGSGRLRIRWSQRQQKWCLEEKIASQVYGGYVPSIGIKVQVGPKGHMREEWIENDSYVRMVDGYALVGYYDVGTLQYPDWLIRDIQSNDKRVHGGSFLEVLKKIEEREDRTAHAKEAAASDDRNRWAVDLYDSWRWKQGERRAVPRNYQSE